MTYSSSRQHTKPYILLGADDANKALPLERLDFNKKDEMAIDESWLQNILFDHPNLLPINEIEPAFGPLIPICTELPTGAGPLDIMYASNNGLITIVECKLWRNPEARREVVGQILDYAKELSMWDYEDLDEAIKATSSAKGNSLFNIVSRHNDDVDEKTFIDAVSRNLQRGRFLLLIVGDGIREGVENIANFLQVHANLNFTFALIEEAVYRVPDELGAGLLVQPRIISRTVEIERAVLRIEDGEIKSSPPPEHTITHKKSGKRIKITEDVFIEGLGKIGRELSGKMKILLDKANATGVTIVMGDSSLMLKTDDKSFNFGTFHLNNTFRQYGLGVESMHSLGITYLQELASLFDGGSIFKPNDPFSWSVKIGERYPTIDDVLLIQDKWLGLIEKTISAYNKLQYGE